MDNEQLLTRGICPKCYRPLYESKYTDKILCDCEITTQPMDNIQKQKNWEEDFPHENGKYLNKCINCGEKFIGHKRRVQCKECSSVGSNKLKQIREGEIPSKIRCAEKYNCPECKAWIQNIKVIQSETLEYGKQLGREEVIEEIKRYVEEIQIRVFGNLDQVSVFKILSKLNQLKEQKK